MVGPREYRQGSFSLLLVAFLSTSSFEEGNHLKLLCSPPSLLLDDLGLINNQKHKLVDFLLSPLPQFYIYIKVPSRAHKLLSESI